MPNPSKPDLIGFTVTVHSFDPVKDQWDSRRAGRFAMFYRTRFAV
jgi:hypothetical protein